jgi:SAM-dependent methyltransferase
LLDIAMTSAARQAPAVARNREPILAVLQQYNLAGTVLEIASGSGEHAVWFAAALPRVTWQPTDRDPAALESIAAWREMSEATNVLPPLLLDATTPDAWPVGHADAVVAINMIHIAPWQATLGLMAGAARVLPPGGLLFLYGPFRIGGVHTAESNAAFDASLQSRDPAWGVRNFEEVVAAAAARSLAWQSRIEMPANNQILIFAKSGF